MMNVMQNMDALTHQLIVTITINVPMILATHNTDAHTNATNANSKMLAILSHVIQPLDVNILK
jgi:hypothetical protein